MLLLLGQYICHVVAFWSIYQLCCCCLVNLFAMLLLVGQFICCFVVVWSIYLLCCCCCLVNLSSVMLLFGLFICRVVDDFLLKIRLAYWNLNSFGFLFGMSPKIANIPITTKLWKCFAIDCSLSFFYIMRQKPIVYSLIILLY